LELTDDQELFRDTTQRFLASEMPMSKVRALWEHRDGYDAGWWRQAAELGWTSMLADESAGGGSVSGRPTEDAAIIAEEIGRTVAPGPFLPVNIVSAGLTHADADTHGAVLAALVSGEATATWAFTERSASWDLPGVAVTATVSGGEVLLAGEKCFVEAAATADHFLVTARTGDGLTQVLVPAGTDGVSVVRGRSVDLTRRFGDVRFDGVRLPRSAVVGEVGGAAATVERQLLVALALQCAEMVGLADRTFRTTLEYAQDRFAFGRPIASFQALKHRIADMLVWLELAKAAADQAARDVDDDAGGQQSSVAKAYVGSRMVDLIHDCVQINGGIGLTWEHDIHLFLRRALLDQALYGTPDQHRERLATLLDV
jgi:alkylation response protein AidB-like acyl-CoA dehydrogenase